MDKELMESIRKLLKEGQIKFKKTQESILL